jgi:hypothetical protein
VPHSGTAMPWCCCCSACVAVLLCCSCCCVAVLLMLFKPLPLLALAIVALTIPVLTIHARFLPVPLSCSYACLILMCDHGCFSGLAVDCYYCKVASASVVVANSCALTHEPAFLSITVSLMVWFSDEHEVFYLFVMVQCTSCIWCASRYNCKWFM